MIHAAAGNINESDVNLAIASSAIIIGFRVDLDPSAQHLADMEELDIKIYEIIYEIVDDVTKALKGMLDPTYAEKVIGSAEIRQVFEIPKAGKIAGCMVLSGMIRRNARARIYRGGKIIHEGPVESLKRFTQDVREVRQNFECGIKVGGFETIEPGDRLEVFVMERTQQE